MSKKQAPILKGKWINNPLWRDSILVVYGKREALKEYCDANDFDVPDLNVAAYVHIDEFNTPIFIYLGESLKRISNVTHELLHYCMWLLGNSGVEINLNDFAQHEQLTYLLGYCIDIVYENKTWLKYSKRKNGFIEIK